MRKDEIGSFDDSKTKLEKILETLCEKANEDSMFMLNDMMNYAWICPDGKGWWSSSAMVPTGELYYGVATCSRDFTKLT